MKTIDVELFVIIITFLLSSQKLTIIDKKGSFGANIIYALLVVCSKHKFYDGKSLEVVVFINSHIIIFVLMMMASQTDNEKIEELKASSANAKTDKWSKI